MYPYRQVSSLLRSSWVSRIGIASLAQHFWDNATPQREAAGSGLRGSLSGASQETFLLEVFWGELLPKSQSSIPSTEGSGEVGGGLQPWTQRDAVGCSRRRCGKGDPQPTRVEGSPHPQTANHPGECISASRTGIPASQPLSSATTPLQTGKRLFPWHRAGSTASEHWLAVGFALQQVQRQS